MPQELLAPMTTNITQLKTNPMAVVTEGGGQPIAVLKSNKVAFYCVPPEHMKTLIEGEVPDPYTLPEQTNQAHRIFVAIRANVHNEMGISQTCRMYQVGGEIINYDQPRYECSMQPMVARLKLLRQFYFEILEEGYVPNPKDIQEIKDHLDTLARTRDYDFFTIAISEPRTPGTDDVRRMMIQEIIRLIEDREWFLTIQREVSKR